MNSDNHQSGSNDFELYADVDLDNVEISDIPLTEADGIVYQSGISSQIVKLGRRLPKRRRTWRWLMGGAIGFLLLGLLFSNLSALKASVLNLLPMSTTPPSSPLSSNSMIMPDTNSGPQIIIGVKQDERPFGRYVTAPNLAAPAPQNCAAAPGVTSSREIGSDPVWLYGFDGPRATVHLYGMSQPIAHNVYGWPVLIQLMVRDSFTLPVTLSAGTGHLHATPAIFFAFDPGERPMDSIILGTQQSVVNPIHPEVGQRAVWIATMYLFGAGCYTLKAAWPGGQWSINFAAGR